MPVRLVARVLSAALLLGILGDWLLRADRLGFNFFLGIAALVVVAATLVRWERDSAPVRVLLLWFLPPFFAFGVAWRDAEVLTAWNILTVAATLALPVICKGSSAPGFSWTLDCERVLAGGVSRWGSTIRNRRRWEPVG